MQRRITSWNLSWSINLKDIEMFCPYWRTSFCFSFEPFMNNLRNLAIFFLSLFTAFFKIKEACIFNFSKVACKYFINFISPDCRQLHQLTFKFSRFYLFHNRSLPKLIRKQSAKDWSSHGVIFWDIFRMLLFRRHVGKSQAEGR